MTGPSSLPSAVVFDMDGLMLDTEPLAARAWCDAASSAGIEFDTTVSHRLIGRTFGDCRTLIAEHHGAAYPVDTLMSGWHGAYDAIVEREGVAVKAGLVELLDWLEGENIDKAVATSTRRVRAQDKLARAGVLDRFSTVVGGDDVVRGKPEPDIFLFAAQRLACSTQQCLVLEDSMPGFRAAIRAGMSVIVVPDLAPPVVEAGDPEPHVLASLFEVRAHLATLPARRSKME